jgi:RecA-family ATPase
MDGQILETMVLNGQGCTEDREPMAETAVSEEEECDFRPRAKPWWHNAQILQTHCLAEVPMKAPVYIISDKHGGGILPVGLSVIGGDPKASKSTLLRMFLSIFSSGQDQLQSDGIGECLYLSFEDDEGSVQLPDVLANGGNPWRFRIANSNWVGNAKTMKRQVLAPVAMFLDRNPRCKVVVVDVLSGMLASMGINSNSAEKCRAVLEPLNALGLEFGVAVVVLHHNHKAASPNPLHRLAGTIQVGATARLIWSVEKHPENENLRVIRPAGGNIKGHSKGLVIAQEPISLEEGLKRAREHRINLGDNAEKLEFFRTYLTDEPVPQAVEAPQKAEGSNKTEQCAAFMGAQIEAEGSILSEELEARCLQNWTKGTYNRARHLLKEQGYRTVKDGSAWKVLPPVLGDSPVEGEAAMA